MAANQYLIPGGSYVNEDTDAREFLIVGGSYLNETSSAPVGVTGFRRLLAGERNHAIVSI